MLEASPTLSRRPWKRATIIGLASFAVVAVAAEGQQPNLQQRTDAAIRTYEQGYTELGECLNGSAYDQAQGARVETTTIDNQPILKVVPNSNMLKVPLALNFTINGNPEKPSLLFADHITAAELHVSGCALPQGT